MAFPVEGFVVDEPRLDLVRMCSDDRLHATLRVERFGQDLGVGLESVLHERHAVDAEVAKLGFVGEEDDVGHVANTVLVEHVFHVERVFKGCTFTGACAVTGADDERLTLATLHLRNARLELLGSMHGMRSRAHGDGVTIVRAEAGGRVEIQFGPGRVDEEVVRDRLGLTLAGGRRVDDVDVGLLVLCVALRMDGYGLRLRELDLLALVDGRERKHHLRFGHVARTDPDVRRDPIPLRIRRHDMNSVLLADQPLEMERGGVA